jgi:hypothetical protein
MFELFLQVEYLHDVFSLFVACAAAVAISIVHADRPAAFRAGPSDLFVCDELPNSKCSNVLQVLEHAHPVFGPVPFIELFQPGTGKLLTLKAKPRFGFLDDFTILDLAADAVGRFIDVTASAAGTFLFVPQISRADTAVNPAGSDQ